MVALAPAFNDAMVQVMNPGAGAAVNKQLNPPLVKDADPEYVTPGGRTSTTTMLAEELDAPLLLTRRLKATTSPGLRACGFAWDLPRRICGASWPTLMSSAQPGATLLPVHAVTWAGVGMPGSRSGSPPPAMRALFV